MRRDGVPPSVDEDEGPLLPGFLRPKPAEEEQPPRDEATPAAGDEPAAPTGAVSLKAAGEPDPTTRPAPRPERGRWGPWAIVPLAVTGLPLAAALYGQAYSLAWKGADWYGEVFWGATLLALVSAWVAAGRAEDRGRACFWLAVGLAAVFSVPKLLRAPGWFNFYDELAHWRATSQLLGGAELLGENPLNRAVGFYPGLHGVTGALAALTGWSVFTAGNVVTVAAHVLSGGAVYLLAARLLGRPRVALLAAGVFMANPAYFYFDAQFSYETLALPLVSVVLLLALSLPAIRKRARLPVAVLAALAIGAVAVTHHASSYVLAGILAGAAVVAVARRHPRKGWPLLLALAVVAVAAPVAWTLSAARYTLDYLGPYIASNLGSVPSFVRREEAARPLFAGSTLPAYEIAGSFGSVLVLAALFAGGLWLLLRDRTRRTDPGWQAVVLLGSAYFVSLPLVALRIDQAAKRLWEFAFIGLAPVAALALAALARRLRWAAPVALLTVMAVLLVGGVATRSGAHIRYPGPYVPSADPRSMTTDVVASAEWLRAAEGPGNRVIGDRTLSATMGAYGDQYPVTWQYYGWRVWDVVMPDLVTPGVTAELDRSSTSWVALDLRTATAPPLTGYYFDEAEPGAFSGRTLSRPALDKFDAAPFERRYDNGNVVLYRYPGLGP
jgi:hypothetical protein